MKHIISALSSNNLDNYEYLTGEDLGLKPNSIEQATITHKIFKTNSCFHVK